MDEEEEEEEKDAVAVYSLCGWNAVGFLHMLIN